MFYVFESIFKVGNVSFAFWIIHWIYVNGGSEFFYLVFDILYVSLCCFFLSSVVVGSDCASFFDDFLYNLYGRLKVLVELEFGVLNEGTGGVFGDDVADCGPENSFEYFIREEVRRTPLIANAAYK